MAASMSFYSFFQPAICTSAILSHTFDMSVQDSQTIQRPLDDSDNGPGMVIASAILGFVSTVIVLLRFLGKRLSRQPIGLDDYLCVAALIMQHVLLVSGCISVVEGGLGRDIRLVTAEDPNSVVTLYKVWDSLSIFPLERLLNGPNRSC